MSALPARDENAQALIPLADQGPSTALAPVPLYSADQMTGAIAAYQRLQQALDKAMPDQIINLEGRPFRKKGYWRAVAVAFGLELEAVSERREMHGEFDDGRPNFGYLVVYQARTKSGRVCTGDGTCFAIEKAPRKLANKWAELPRQASEHNIRAHAHTRAFNRAVSNLVGFGEVSAEEMSEDEPPRLAPAPPPAPPNYDGWLADLEAAADNGDAALRQAVQESNATYKQHLRATGLAKWDALKKRALSADAKKRVVDDMNKAAFDASENAR